jgi:hypothetical protein
MRNTLALILLLAGTLSIATAGDSELEAWWLRTTFAADTTEYRGIPVTAINPRWTKIGVITYEKLPPEAQDDLPWMHKERFSFEIKGNLSGKGFEDCAVTGVYDGQQGASGRFLLVLRKSKDGTWRRILLHEEPGERGFSVLVRRAGQIYWGTCMQCEEFRRLIIGSDTASLGE